MRYRVGLSLIAAMALGAVPASAAPAKTPAKDTPKATAKPAPKASAKSATKTPAKASAKASPKKAAPEPVPVYESRPGIHVPQAILMKPLTPAEAEANAVWNLRAGLNVAALQCQYSKFLATVRIYNDLLKHHSAELAAAQSTMVGHFKRYDGIRALNSFDSYTTKTYNSYSTLDAQYAFCLSASEIGRGALFVAKGALGKFALAATPVLRVSLTPVAQFNSLQQVDAMPIPLMPLDN